MADSLIAGIVVSKNFLKWTIKFRSSPVAAINDEIAKLRALALKVQGK